MTSAPHRSEKTIPAWAAVLAAAMALAQPAQAPAQSLYRCGNEFSQTPCAKDATAQRMPSSSAPDRPETPGGKDLCIAAASKAFGFDEPQPQLFDAVNKTPAQVIEYAGTPIAAKTYLLQNRDRVHQGLMVPARSLVCHLSDDERRLLRLAPAEKPAARPG